MGILSEKGKDTSAAPPAPRRGKVDSIFSAELARNARSLRMKTNKRLMNSPTQPPNKRPTVDAIRKSADLSAMTNAKARAQPSSAPEIAPMMINIAGFFGLAVEEEGPSLGSPKEFISILSHLLPSICKSLVEVEVAVVGYT